VGHAAMRHRMLLRRQARAAKKHGNDSAHAVRLTRAAERQAAVLASAEAAAARVMSAFPAGEPGVLEAVGFQPEDFQRVGMPWPGGSSGNGP
jgi:hypothetical protein